MTNEEHIKKLKDILSEATETEDAVCYVTSEDKETLEAAISALSQPQGDLISREDALMALTGEIKETDTIETIIARFARRIRKLPPVTPQPKTGYWKKRPNGFPNGFKCSKCLIVHSHTSIFCPSCGAKMVEQETKINEDISKGFEEFTRMMFRQGQEESEENKCR